MTRTETLAEGVTLYLGDCREVLAALPKADAVVTDPPYGINAARKRGSQRFGWRDFGVDGWDDTRISDDALSAVLCASETVILWGGNYYIDHLAPGTKWLIWDRGQSEFSLADCELAWCSFDGAVRRLMVPRSVALRDGKEHPTQKSLDVMRWCIQQIPPPAPKTILDPFMGCGTTGVAAVKLGRKFIGIEIEPKYFDICCRRIADALKQPDMFIEKPMPAKQQTLGL